MQSLALLLERLAHAGIQISSKDDKLVIQGKASALTDELRHELQAQKPALLAWLGSQRNDTEKTQYPLNPEQTRLWFMDKLSQNPQGFVLKASFILSGTIDTGLWQNAIGQVVARHQVLSLQRIEDNHRAWLELADVAPKLELCAQGDPLDLPGAGLFRVVLQPHDGGHQLTFLIHHMIADRHSMAILINDCFAAANGQPLGPAPQFTERLLQSPRPGAGAPHDLSGWLARLHDAPAEVALPFDRPRPPERSATGAMVSKALSAGADLDLLARHHGATPFMVYLALYTWLLHRWSGDEDMVVGCPVSTRKSEADQDMVGFMVRTVPLRLRVNPDDDLATHINGVKRILLETLDQPPVTLDQIVSALNPRRSLNRNPLFQIMFVLQAQPLSLPELPGLVIAPEPVAPLAPEVDLNLSLERTGDPLTPYIAHLEYDPDLFGRRTAQAFLDQFDALCCAAHDDATPPAKPENIAVQWQGDLHPLPAQPVHHLILETLNALAPATPLLKDHSATLSVADVLGRIALAHRALDRCHPGPGARIGLCLPRLTELVPALIAIWQRGACAVFLPANGPVNAIIERAQRAGLSGLFSGTDSPVTAHDITGDYAVIDWPQTLNATASRSTICDAPDTTALGTPALASWPAYICFTSGSTGEPKAVVISHASLLNHALDIRQRFNLEQTDRLLQFAAPGFDVFLEEVIPGLLAGAFLVQPEPSQQRDLDAFSNALQTNGITVANLPAAFWHTWVHERIAHGAHVPDTLRLLVTGSEAVQAGAARLWRTHVPRCRLLSAYGLTETTITACVYPVDQVPDGWSTLPLGLPIQNTGLAVVDRNNQPLPPLCIGQIQVSGQATMLTAARTAAELDTLPVTGAGQVLTGDLGRRDLDGQLWCLGRRDRQVKIRGIRVEPASLENALVQFDGIREAAALVITGGTRPRLVAFATGSKSTDPLALKAALQAQLPDVLVPEYIQLLPALPHTPQGKTDYTTLRELALNSRTPGTATQPVNEREQLIARLFSEVLQRDGVGPDDNFFDLGGDSISSLQVISRARRAGLDVSAKAIFEHQTVRAIARYAAPTPNVTHDAEAIGPVPATPILAWFSEQMRGSWHQFNQAVMISLPDKADLAKLETALNAVIQCHEVFGLTLTRSPGAEAQYQIPSQRPPAKFSVLQRPAAQEESVWQALRQTHLDKTQRSLDPASGVNVAALALPAEQCLMLAVHHLCIDVLSWQVVLRDLQQAYDALVSGHAPALVRHGLPWRKWALALQAFSQTPDVRAALPFWLSSLSATPDTLSPGLPASPGVEANARSCRATLDAALTQHLLRKVPAAWGLRMDEAMLTALGMAHAAGNGRVLRVDFERNGRTLPLDDLDISETVGWFTSVLPMTLDTVTRAHDMAQTVKSRLAELPHDGLSFGLLRYGDNAEAVRQLAALPVADVLVNYVGVLDGWSEGPFQPVDADTGPTIAPDLARSHRIELNAGVVAGQLLLAINYAEGPASDQAAHALLKAIEAGLNQIALETGYTPEASEPAHPADSPLDETTVPVTPLQHSILLHSLHDAQTYFDQLHFAIKGSLNTHALQTAWATLLERHAALRSAFRFDAADEPCQTIATGVDLPWHLHDWSTLDNSRIETAIGALMLADREKGFDLDRPPLMRMHLIQRAPDRYDWVWSSHHLILDGWSVSVLMQELLEAYTAALSQRPPVLPPAPDWAAFTRRWHRLDAGKARDWWATTLANATPTLMACTSPGRGAQTHRQNAASITLSGQTREHLAAACKQHRVPLGVFMQATWALLLRRYRTTDPVVFGITFAHRPAEFDRADALVGMTINTVPVIVSMTPDMPLPVVLDTLRQQSFERADHAFIGLEDILEASRHDATHPLFDTLLLVQNYPRPKALSTPDGLTLELRDVQEQTNFALTAIVTTGEEAQLSLAWDTTRIDDALAQAILEHWHQLVQGMIQQPEACVRDLSVYTPATLGDRLALTRGPQPGTPALPALDTVAHWSTIIPDHTAVQASEGAFSYRELATACNHISQQLQAQGITRGEPVAIVLPRGARAVATLLGVMHAGAMALPIDAAYPPERITWMLHDSQARWLLTDTPRQSTLNTPPDVSTILIDQMPETRLETAGAQGATLTPDSPAYLIYTSGSTGQPKGAMTHHGGLANMIRLQQHHLAPGAADRVLQFAALSFDASIWETFMALGSGATLVIPDPQQVRFGEELLDTLERERITMATLPPSLMAALPVRDLPSLRMLMVAGEACTESVTKKWGPGRRLFNGYGPSETSVCSSLHEITEHDSYPLPIGKPAAHTLAYVVDADGQLAPAGAEGELVIGGDGVGPGYLNRVELTTARFKPDPWATGPNARVYYTGDRVKFAADGTLTFTGRLDRQLKVRGFRVEPGEIERQIEQLAPVEKALVGLPANADADPLLLAWVLPRAGHTIDTQSLRDALARRLPGHMVPGVILTLASLPLTPNGKTDWKALPMPSPEASAATAATPASDTAVATDPFSIIATRLESIWAQLLRQPRVDWHRNFFDLGGQSLLLVKMQPLLREAFKVRVPTRVLFEKATIHALAQWLLTHGAASAATMPNNLTPVAPALVSVHETPSGPSGQEPPPCHAIAIIGMACRFPGADSIDAFWKMLADGREGITTFDTPVVSSTSTQTHWVPRRGIIPDSDAFDAGFFGIGARDALLLDPQHRLFLEGIWNAFEDAAEVPEGNVGIFAGCSHNTWLREVLVPAGENISGSAGFHAITANDKDFLVTQAAYRLNLSGPAVTVQSACSTSLIAVAQAVDALRAGRCEMAVAGGVSLTFGQSDGYLYEPGMILSPDGHCRPFAADAAGTVPGAGMGVVLLKPLQKAIAEGNRIYAVIRGTGVSNDGARKMSFAAPGIDGQAKAIRAALDDAGLEGQDIDLIEAHGTGTALGDPVEITALARVYAGERPVPLQVGSVKSNIGHADAAAGVAGLIKAALSLHHRYIPASLHAATPNPKLDGGARPWFCITSRGTPLPDAGRPSRAGVSSFGIGGTNAHVILEQAPTAPEYPLAQPDWQVVPVSTPQPDRLAVYLDRLAQHVRHTRPALHEVAITLQRGRRHFKARKAFVARNTEALTQALSAPPGLSEDKKRPGKVALLLPGQGAQHPGMGYDLYQRFPVFRDALAPMSDALRPMLEFSLIDALQDPACGTGFWQDTRIAQPALLAISLACARCWASLGLQPDLMLGHSLGEYTAACLAGVFSTEDALMIVAERARLMAQMPAGSMLAVALDETEVARLLAQHPLIDLAAVNGPRQTVLAGPTQAIETLAHALSRQGTPAQRLHTSHAFHSRAMAPAAQALESFLGSRTLNRPNRKFVSNLTGTWITPEQAQSAGYWARHMLAPVRFAQGLKTLQDKGAGIAIEAGPGQVLSSLAQRQGLIACPSLNGPRTDDSLAPAHVQSVARLWENGIDIDWNAFSPQPARRLALPGYPWKREVYRPAAITQTTAEQATPRPARPPARRTGKPAQDDWFFVPRYERQTLAPKNANNGCIAVYSDDLALARTIAHALDQPARPARVAPSAAELVAQIGSGVAHLVFAASPFNPRRAQDAMAAISTLLLDCRDAVLASHPAPLHIDLITFGGVNVQGNEALCPANTAIIAAFRVLAQEFPEHAISGLDLSTPHTWGLAIEICRWLDTDRNGKFLAYRQGHYWVETVAPCPMPAPQAWPMPAGAPTLITGASGGVGQAFALDIARHAQNPHLVLASHRTLVPETLRHRLEALGATVSLLTLDLADEITATHTLSAWQSRHGPFRAVIHAAGLADYGGILARRDATSITHVMAPKIAGLHALETTLAGLPLDAMVLCSTLGSFLPAAKFGQVAYSAANAYLDAAAACLAQQQPWRVVTIHWDDWAQAGMTVAARERAGLPPLPESNGLLSHEGPAAVRQVLPTALTRVAISVNDLPALMTRSGPWLTDPALPIPDTQEPGPGVTTAQTTPSTTLPAVEQLESNLQTLFCKVLNVAACRPGDSFFDLGGHSLLAMQLINAVNESTGIDLALMDLFDAPSPQALAACLINRNCPT